jgi:CRP-like cAMP-binding protein
MAPVSRTVAADTLAEVALFSPLSVSERAALIAVAKPVQYAAGETIVRQGEAGRSLFVVVRGEASVRLAGTDGEVARLRNGDVFGEMSLLTGEPRTATVSAVDDCDLVEIDAEGFRTVVMANPSVLERVTTVTAARREELDRHRETHTAATSPTEIPRSLLERVRDFLRL